MLERSQFLNALFAEKSFSWTAVMMDLEKVLPTGVQVTSLEPQMAKDGDCEHSASRERRPRSGGAVAAESGDFAAVCGSAAGGRGGAGAGDGPGGCGPAVGPGAVEFEILSGYNPLPVVAAKELVKEQPVPATKTGKRAVTRGGAGGVR